MISVLIESFELFALGAFVTLGGLFWASRIKELFPVAPMCDKVTSRDKEGFSYFLNYYFCFPPLYPQKKVTLSHFPYSKRMLDLPLASMRLSSLQHLAL